jgi:energy-coupling factor transporter ATP-binding protein EcfA2
MSAFTFVHPSNILLAGPSGAGKTTFLVGALKNGLFYPTPTRIVWIYGESQGAHKELDYLSATGKLPRIEYLRNDTDYDSLLESFDPSQTNLLVLDDQMNEGKSKASEFSNLFTKGSHHRNITVVYLVQNVFEKGGANRTVSLNSHYMVLFKNPRDKTQVQVLGRQMFPEHAKFLAEAFKQATETGFSNIVLDLRQETPDELRVLSNVLERIVSVYVPSKFKDI